MRLSFKTPLARRNTNSLKGECTYKEKERGNSSLFPNFTLRFLERKWSKGRERVEARGIGRWSVKQRVEGKLKRSSRKKGVKGGDVVWVGNLRSVALTLESLKTRPVVLAIRMTNDVVDSAKLAR